VEGSTACALGMEWFVCFCPFLAMQCSPQALVLAQAAASLGFELDKSSGLWVEKACCMQVGAGQGVGGSECGGEGIVFGQQQRNPSATNL